MINPQDLVELFVSALVNAWGYIWGTAGVMWTEAKQKNVTDEAAQKYGKKWIGHMVADCSGLFAWAFKKLGGYMYHGSNTMYLKYCTANGTLTKGARSDGQELKPGTAVFVWNEEKKKYSHVGLFIGNGEVIEAMGTINGVVKSQVTNKKWTHWGELKGVNYGSEPTPVPVTKPTLRKGDRGEYVTLAQTELIQRGYDLGSWGADGKFGNATEKAVKQFQQDWGLKADGVIGPNTWAMLDSTPAKVLYTVTVPHMSLKDAEALAALYQGATITKEGDQ
jgi:hypothetical protein